ncbi:DNA mismatch repair protein MutT [Saccharibacillus sp. O23]|uniref:NUDIX domain-containing protein n=1 Tax=Saccharibacillus sp. O23 TaxID=2009338 RepID=UPI000B4E6C32|nr:NUDIX domain-containing protein [Saccharibacillus sp. O23]OWR32330.1 DNA mismatch repair protein MutT [Saccharibacillus sp. O23]
MTRRIIVTGGAIIRDGQGRILLQKRSDYGDWGLPGGGMEAGETIEQTMIREVKEETGLEINHYELYSIYSGPRMNYTYPDGNEVTFVMFLFNAEAELAGKVSEDQTTLNFEDDHKESLYLEFKDLKKIDLEKINAVQKPVFEDLKHHAAGLLRS